MPKYMFIYHGGATPAPEEAEASMAAWMQWLRDLGDAVIDGGNPAGASMTVSESGVSEGGGADPCAGYSLVNAAGMEAACEMAKACPIIAAGGRVEVAEAMGV